MTNISRERRGVALVSVLILVVLLTAVIIGFWATSTLEYTASRSYKASLSARLMADMAVNLVQGQINEATSQRQRPCRAE
jgi:type II secretory pathway component PulK